MLATYFRERELTAQRRGGDATSRVWDLAQDAKATGGFTTLPSLTMPVAHCLGRPDRSTSGVRLLSSSEVVMKVKPAPARGKKPTGTPSPEVAALDSEVTGNLAIVGVDWKVCVLTGLAGALAPRAMTLTPSLPVRRETGRLRLLRW